LSSIRAAIKTRRDFLGQCAGGHPNPLFSVIVGRSSQPESSIAALSPVRWRRRHGRQSS
jgi:hypothetical protein